MINFVFVLITISLIGLLIRRFIIDILDDLPELDEKDLD
jgi:hypothetical protein